MAANLDVYKAVVRLTFSSGVNNLQSLGSGVVFSPAGLVITNNHVIENADFGTAFGQISVESSKRVDQAASDPVPAELVIRNEVYDLAVIRLTGGPVPQFIDVLRSPTIDPSIMERRIRVLGYPPLGGATITVTRGIVSGFDEDGNLKTDAEINPGNSGGAALDDLGTFLGIPSFVCAEDLGKLGFIISVDRIRQWLGSVLKSGVPETTEQLSAAFASPNLNFSGDNLDRSNKYPRILGKFAAVETLLKLGEFEKAMPHIDFIIENRPRSGLAYHYRGNALLGLGRYVEAADEYRTCLAYNPGHIPALGNMGLALIQLKRHAEALQIFQQIIDQSEDPAQLWTSYTNLAQIYKDWGDDKVSKLYREKATKLSAAAKERMLQYKHHRNGGVATLIQGIVYAEIKMEDEAKNADK